jgi:hypothetical protein
LATNRVEIENSYPTVVFKDVSVNTAASVIISGSSATFIAAGINTITSTADGNAGIECSSDSNITIQAAGADSLFVTAAEKSAGIGTNGNGTCLWVTILNGSVDSGGGTGIGTGWSESGSHSKLEGLSIHNGSIQATGGYYGTGIGSGSAFDGTSIVWNVTILNGTITASSGQYGSNSGSGRRQYGNSTVLNLAILNGNITASSSFYGPGIGSGCSFFGDSTVWKSSVFANECID